MSWPELVGKSAEEATRLLHEEEPSLRVEVRTTRDLSLVKMMTRVQLYVDNNNVVVEVPRRG